jgi:hypothetical protein
MSKEHDTSEKSKKISNQTSEHPKEAAAGAGAGAKKPDVSSTKDKGHTPLPGGCFAWGCKGQALKFNFCAEHYDHFKFGLIKKTGEPVSDYEKKIEHYMAHKRKRGAPRAA